MFHRPLLCFKFEVILTCVSSLKLSPSVAVTPVLPVFQIMAASVDEKWSTDKLDASNWMTWKFQMRHLLLAKGLWGQVDGSDVLAPGANEQARDNFQLKEQKAFSSIVMGISTSQLYLVTSCEGPKEAWDTLRNHNERGTLANKLFLKKTVLSKRNEGGLSNGDTFEKYERNYRQTCCNWFSYL